MRGSWGSPRPPGHDALGCLESAAILWGKTVRSRVVLDGNLVTAAGVTAGLDAALVVASLLGGDALAQEIQLSIQYAPNPVFHSGMPDTAPAEVLRVFNESYSAIAASREAEAQRFAAILGVAV